MGKGAQETVLRLEGVTKRIGGKAIVNDLSFELKKGEIVGLLGPNGAGKTTTIRMIVGLIKMTEGDITVGGASVRKNFENAIRHVGGIIENPEFYPYMTGLDNLKQYQRMSDGVTDSRVREAAELVGLQHALGKKVKTYSLGMRQRLGIAQALLHKPSVLILDEPTNGLDPAGIREMRDYMKHVAEREGIAILVSSHLLSEMELMCSRVVVIQEGKLVTVRAIGEGAGHPDGADAGEGIVTVSIQVSDPERALAALSAMEGIRSANRQGDAGRLSVTLPHERIPSVIQLLGGEGIGVYRVEEIKASLEEEFMKWTGGNRIA